jgi:hypothetical protein
MDQALAIVMDDGAEMDRRLSASREYLSIDPQHAGVNYVAGRLHYERGNAESAGDHLRAARDFDVCPLRATSPIMQAVVETAQRNEIALIHTPRLLDRRDWRGHRLPDGIVDPEWFVDHLHPTIAGHQLIAAEIASQLIRIGWIESSASSGPRYDALAKEHLDTLGEEYYARGKQRLEGLRRWAAGRAGQLMPTQSRDQ